MANENNGGGAIELAKAYVQIVPSTKGIEGELNKAMGSAGTEAGKAGGNGIASGLSKAGAAIGKAAMAGLTAASGAVTALAKNAVDSYAEYEQLAGGVETLFQSSSDTVKKYADEAFATAGLSANAYMETVTGFSAALIQATGRGEQQDIEQLKAELEEGLKDAKRGYEDQYDAAKASWDERIKLAQKAKASNLEVLRAQRDEELKALKRSNEDQLEALKQANKDRVAAAEEANMSSVTTEESLARAAEAANRAVIDMSDNANKMGTSMESIQNAYQGFAKQNYTMLDNLKLGYGGTKEEMERLILDASKLTDVQSELGVTVDANSLSFDNIVNAISVVQKQMGIAGTTSAEAAHTIEGSMGATKAAWQNLITAIGKGEGISESVDSLMTSLFGGEGGGGLLENMIPRVTTVMKGIGDFITKAAPIIAPKVGALVKDLLPTLLKTAVSVIKETLPVLIQTVVDMTPIFIDGVITLISTVVEQLPALLQPLLDALPVLLPQLINGIVAIIVMICDHFTDIIGPIITALPDIINSISDAVISNLPLIIAGIIKLIAQIVVMLPGLLVGLVETFIHAIVEPIRQFFTDGIGKLGDWFNDIGAVIGNAARNFWTTFVDNVWRPITEKLASFGNWIYEHVIKPVSEFFAGLWEGIKAGAKAALNGIIKFANIMIDGLNAMLWPIRKLIETVAKVLGKDWTMDNIKIPHIPELAEGGILKRGQVGLLEGTGAEAVVPLEKNTEWIHRVASEINTANADSYTDADEIVSAIRNMKLWLDGRAIVGGITDQMDKSLGNRSTMIGRGVATA